MLLPSAALEEWEARRLGYSPLTVTYYLPGERTMLDNIMRDLDKGAIDYCLVGVRSACQVWRKKMIVFASDEDVMAHSDAIYERFGNVFKALAESEREEK